MKMKCTQEKSRYKSTHRVTQYLKLASS